jgi:two-component system sensor histidine kinase BaeS
MRTLAARGVAVRMALASLVVALAALAIIAVAVLEVARTQFEHLMMSQGATQSEATAMFQQSVGVVFAGAAAVAAVASIGLAVLLARHLARPLEAMGAAADRLSHGDYSARVPTRGPQEIRTVAESFNQMADSLEEQERVRQDFIAGAAHELLTPLTNLQGYLEGLRDGVIPPESSVFASLHDEAERLARLSRSLLTLADLASGARAPAGKDVDLARVVAAVVELTQPAFDRRNVTVTVDMPQPLMAAMTSDHATQVLFNLLQNASRYTDQDGGVQVVGGQQNGMVRVEISNTGPGISNEDLTRVFERFFRVDSSRSRDSGGHGLGLAVVKQLIGLSGGEVGAGSTGGLTNFWFTLPTSARTS